jgi:hypothetical protein
MGSLLSVTIGMETGRQQMPKIYGMAGRNLGARGFQLFWYVAAREFTLHRFRPETEMGICLALAHFRRNDFRESGAGSVAHDGTRLERVTK